KKHAVVATATASGPRARSQFRPDLARAGAVCLRHPAVPILTLGLAVLSQGGMLRIGPGAVANSVATVATIAMAGWVGTQRVWYLRGFRGEQVAGRELVSLTVRFVPRFLLLGFLVAVPNILFIQLAVLFWHDPHSVLTA